MCREKPATDHRRSGWTMLELLASLALAALASVAVIGVLGPLAAERDLHAERAAVEPWRRQLAGQLRWDLAHANQYAWSERQLVLVGPASRDPVTKLPLHRPCEIVYESRTIGPRKWLVRTERHTDEPTNQNVFCELVLPDVVEVLLVPWQPEEDDELTASQALRKRRRDQAQENSTGAVPDRIRCSLWSASQLVHEEVYFRH